MSEEHGQEIEDLKLLTVDELGRMLSMTKGSLYNLVYTRQIPFLKIGKRLRFNREDILKWLDEKKILQRDL